MPASMAQIAAHGGVAARIRAALAENEMTSADLGRAIKPSSKNPAAVVSPWLNGKGGVPVKLRPKVAKILKIKPEDLEPDVVSASPSKSKALMVLPKGRCQTATSVPASTIPPFTFEVTPDGMAKISANIVTSLAHGKELFDLFLNAHVQHKETSNVT
jgi:hypothetical protein